MACKMLLPVDGLEPLLHAAQYIVSRLALIKSLHIFVKESLHKFGRKAAAHDLFSGSLNGRLQGSVAARVLPLSSLPVTFIK